MRGNSAINIALWDIYGQAVGEPVWRLLGGRTHERVPIYNTCAGWPCPGNQAQALFERNEDWGLKARRCRRGALRGLARLAFCGGRSGEKPARRGDRRDEDLALRYRGRSFYGSALSAADLDKALEPFAKIRNAVGNGMEIMVELHGLWTLPPALRIAQALKPYDIAWLEEPIRFNELDALTVLARHTSIPLAVSERLATRQVFKQVMARAPPRSS